MTRLIKRYGSRKLYDTTESRYILLEDIAEYVRQGEEIKVIDNKSSEDVTGQTLTQVISEEGRKSSNFLPSDLLHDLIRAGESAVNNRVRRLQDGVEGFVKKSFDRLVPLRTVRDEMDHLRNRLEELEDAISRAETHTKPGDETVEEDISPLVETAVKSTTESVVEPADNVPAKPVRKRVTKPRTAKPRTRTTKSADGTTKTRTRRTKAASTKKEAGTSGENNE